MNKTKLKSNNEIKREIRGGKKQREQIFLWQKISKKSDNKENEEKIIV